VVPEALFLSVLSRVVSMRGLYFID
jgi:hypothetical protein